MSTPIQATTFDASSLWPSVGVSDESRTIRKLQDEYSRERQSQASLIWKGILAGEISEIVQNCSVHGWDGNDAEPVSLDAAQSAIEIVKYLPEGMRLPAVVPEPDGDIAFEWCTDDQRRFSLSTSGATLVYAGIFGGLSRQYGEERFFGKIPRTILEILARHFAAA